MDPPKKRPRKLNVALPPPRSFTWNSPYNKEKDVSVSSTELGDGASSRVYLGTMDGNRVAIKKLKGYSCAQGAAFVKAYENFLSMPHFPKVATMFGLCPNSGYVVLEFCEIQIGDHRIHTLENLMTMYGDELPIDLKLLAMTDVIEGIEFLHTHGIIHGDIKPSNVLVNGNNDEFEFKLTDYANATLPMQQSSHSTTLKQLMTPGYMAPELYSLSFNSLPIKQSNASDIYAFAILSYELICNRPAWQNVSMSLMDSVRHGLRPAFPQGVDKILENLIKECWHENPESRPTANMVLAALNSFCEKVHLDDSLVPQDSESADQNLVHLDDSLVQLDYESLDHSVDISLPTHTESSSSQPGNSLELPEPCLEVQHSYSSITQLEELKSKLNIAQYKKFQLEAIEAILCGKDVIVVQPTGSGKSLCYVAPALLNPGKITLIIEPVTAVITDQVKSLQSKGIDAVALGSSAANRTVRSANFKGVFKSTDSNDIPSVAFCTPEYLFGSAAEGKYQATVGLFTTLVNRQDYLYAVVMDEAHKIFDRVNKYRPAFNGMKQLQTLSCKLLAMSATLTSEQVIRLKNNFLHSDNCVVITQGVHRDNLVLQLKRYKRQRQLVLGEDDTAVDECNGQSCSDEPEQSSWLSTALSVADVTESHVTVVYLDFVRDVEQMTELLNKNGTKALKYTGQMEMTDKMQVERKFLKDDVSVLVATEAFELGVNNPRITQVVRVGCPRNLGVLLQEFGRAGRKEGMVANGLLLFNEYIDDKRLGLWLKSVLDTATDDTAEVEKCEIVSNYANAWKFIYSIYHGKCLSWALSYFYGGVDDSDPPTCFVANSPLCMVCKVSDVLCEESIDIKEHLKTLLSTLQQLQNAGLNGITKTLLVGVLMKVSTQYITSCLEHIDADSIPWGCGSVIKGVNMSNSAWCKLIYVGVHLDLLKLSFVFRPFENHYEVHRRYLITSAGEEFLLNPTTMMSLDPCSTTVDSVMILGDNVSLQHKKTTQSRGSQMKPKIMKLIEDKAWIDGDCEMLKYLGFDDDHGNAVCLYFPDCMALPCATTDKHHLLQCLQFSRTQATVKEVDVELDGKKETLVLNRSYCSGVKMCAHEGCTYTVSTKQKINRCTDHESMGLRVTGPCSCHIAYIYPKDAEKDNRRWFVALNSGSSNGIHNHPSPSEWKVLPKVLSDISNAVSRNTSISPKELQKGFGMDYRPMEVSLPTASLGRMRAIVKKARKEAEKIDCDRVNPFSIIASFPAMKCRIDRQCTLLENKSDEIDKLVGTYQLDGDDAYNFSRDKRCAFFQSPFQAHHWSKADALFADIDYTGNQHFPYLFNVVCFNSITKCYMACGRSLMNRQDGGSIGKALKVLSSNVKCFYPRYDLKVVHKEILLDFDEAEANGFKETFGEEVSNILRGCSVHFVRSAMRIAKLINSSVASVGYQVFMSVAKLIPENTSQSVVQTAFKVLSGAEAFTKLSTQLPPPLCSITLGEIDTVRWSRAETWVDWWTRPTVLQKLSKAYSLIDDDDWDELPGTNNPVESINKQSTPSNVKSVSLKPLLEHFYLEDRRQAVLQVAAEAGVTISYSTKRQRRARRPPKAPESRRASIPNGKKAVGLRLSIEFYENADQQTTRWYKGTVISYSRKGYIISFDGCGPDDNEVVKSIKQGVEKGEIKLL